MCSVVWIHTFSFTATLAIPYNTFLEACTHPLSVLHNLSCCSLHALCCDSCCLLITVSYLNMCSVEIPAGVYMLWIILVQYMSTWMGNRRYTLNHNTESVVLQCSIWNLFIRHWLYLLAASLQKIALHWKQPHPRNHTVIDSSLTLDLEVHVCTC